MKFTPTHRPTSAAVLALLLPLLTTASGDNCIELRGDTSYTFKSDGAFAGQSGHIDNQQHCFGSGGGGISIGSPNVPAGAAGNTRLECYFPEHETDAQFYNCNLSLVDGFSAAVTCATASGGWPNSKNDSAVLGCGYDLLSNCPANLKDEGKGVCRNEKGGHVSSLEAVDPAFHACKVSEEYPNTAELYFNMEGAYKFSKQDFPLKCEVGKGEDVPGSYKARRSESVASGHQNHAAAHVAVGKRRVHARHVSARGLLDLVS